MKRNWKIVEILMKRDWAVVGIPEMEEQGLALVDDEGKLRCVVLADGEALTPAERERMQYICDAVNAFQWDEAEWSKQPKWSGWVEKRKTPIKGIFQKVTDDSALIAAKQAGVISEQEAEKQHKARWGKKCK